MITNCNIIMTSQTLSLNIAIKNGKQPNNLITVEDSSTYYKRIISNILKGHSIIIQQISMQNQTLISWNFVVFCYVVVFLELISYQLEFF